VIEQLAVVPEEHGKGVGRSLVEAALAQSSLPLTLWTFQSNVSAQGFYRHLGFTEIDRTDGDNEEGEPDVRFSSAPVLLGQGEGAVGSQGS
jgi:ribosomal protein S18 acetylase RimI-like enzyme